jgi:hypothetical protein
MGNEEDWFDLIKEQRLESVIISRLSTTLRLTPQSLTNHDGNKKQVNTLNRPWSYAKAS